MFGELAHTLNMIIINGLFYSIQKLEKYMIINVSPEVLAEVADVAASVAKIGVKVDWLDDALGNFWNKKKHLDLLRRSKELAKELEQLNQRRDENT